MKRVLVVNDNSGLRKWYSIHVEEKFYRAIPACDGIDAIEELKKKQ